MSAGTSQGSSIGWSTLASAFGASVPTLPFWGWPFAFLPSSGQGQVPLDSQGNIDPNWAVPANALNPWDTAFIQGTQVPGKVAITAKKAQRVDKRHSPGYDGANATMLGFDTADVTMEVQVWTEIQFQDLQAMTAYLHQQMLQAKLQPRGNVQAAVEVQHPKLSMLAISKLYVKEFLPPEPAGEPGVMRMRFVFSEFNPATKGSSATINAPAPGLQTLPTALSAPPNPATGPGSQP